MADIEYQRLTRSRSRGVFSFAVASRTSLWLGPDHLLFVDSNGYAESYKRFYLRDIQAFAMQRSARFLTINVVLGVLFTLFMAIGLATAVTDGKYAFFVMAGIVAILALVNIIRGKSCHCFLRTAVQEEHLPPLNRVRKAEKVFARLRPLIAAAQGGELSPEALVEKIREHNRTESEPVVASPVSPASDPAQPPLTS